MQEALAFGTKAIALAAAVVALAREALAIRKLLRSSQRKRKKSS